MSWNDIWSDDRIVAFAAFGQFASVFVMFLIVLAVADWLDLSTTWSATAGGLTVLWWNVIYGELEDWIDMRKRLQTGAVASDESDDEFVYVGPGNGDYQRGRVVAVDPDAMLDGDDEGEVADE